MFGTSNIIGALIAILITTAVGLGVLNYYNNNFNNEQLAVLAQETAEYDNIFASALNAYVKANFNNNIMGSVTCADLRAGNFLSASYRCTDPAGEQLAGYVSEPWGFPQTWLAAPLSLPNAGILAKFGINNALRWKEFTFLVAQDSMNGQPSLEAFGIAAGNNFTSPQSGYTDNLANYFPESGAEFSQTMPAVSYYDGYSFAISPNIQSNPSYWLFYVLLNTSADTADINYQNLGYSAVCPAGGIIPGQNTTGWQFLMNAIYYNGGTGINYIADIDVASTPTFFTPFYLCIPTAKSIIKTGVTVFPSLNYYGANNYALNQLNTFGAYYDGSGDAYSKVSGQDAPQANQAFYITDGFAKYTLLLSEGYVNGNNDSWQFYYAGAIFWEGEPADPASLCIESALSGLLPPVPPCWPVSGDAGINSVVLN